MGIRLVAAAQYQPVPLALLKTQCHLEASFTAEDATLAVYLAAATDQCQQRIGRSIMLQTWQLDVDALIGEIWLPWPDVMSLASAQYLDGSGNWQEIDAATYGLSDGRVRLVGGAQWPIGPGRFIYTAGYAAGDEATQQAAVPAGIKAWILLAAASLYANREAVATGVAVAALPDRFADGFLDAHKVYA
ncbi:head-tail connector protein [Pigmentiphaga kullae]|uniref:Putative phiE125 gp8 family phage protein n=1 Tax=Pigmentiphaga kullae TaxID=151784 RepID=A0A4Q7NCN8_9BURK|nr:hypothetical protein [Pigmentiphaga kullae]RZS80650.1 putative phiE125 gp8 family phage protein [Pigmentiphaga kullae]